jgi:UDP-glucose 4-epimerase
MRILVTGSAGHLGEGLMLALQATAHDAIGLDRLESRCTRLVGSITDAAFVQRALAGVDAGCTPRPCTSRTSACAAARSSSTST